MWKKSENSTEVPTQNISPAQSHPQPVREQAIIGSSLLVKGDVTGEEDLTIQGQVEGKVILKKNGVTIGKNGRVKADVYGKTISVEGSVQGNLHAEERIIVRQTGNVRGNLHAPRVTLEDGAQFKGSIDMEGKEREKPETVQPTITTPKSDSGGTGAKPQDSGQGRLGINVKPPSKT
ncbi:MAG: polymer-forming cytoskeletal protein [Acidobacteriota bacterium]|nr:MAG: polymer-forming cytoskeletal protein [Acidobacteriota bacterium]